LYNHEKRYKMLVTEKMRKVSIIIHKRRLAQVIDKLGETNLIHIIKKRSEVINPKQITDYITTNLEKIHALQEKVTGIMGLAPLIGPDIKVMKYNFEGTSIEEIIGGIIIEIEENYTKKEELSSQIKELDNRLASLIAKQKLWSDLLELKIDSSRLKAPKDIMLVRIGYVSAKNADAFKEALKSFPHLYDEKESGEEEFIFIISTLRKYSDEIKRIEIEYHARMMENLEEIHLENYRDISEEIKRIEEQKKNLDNALITFLTENYNKLSAYRELLNNLNNILRVENDLNYRSHFVTIEGWIPNSKVDYVMNYCYEITEKTALFFISEDYTPEEHPPSKFKNPKIFQPFETLTRMFGIPNYKEIDPTIIVTFSFPIMYGLMFGDVGHGLMLLIGAILFYYYKKNLTPNWRNLLIILMACGICAMISGFLYGSFFGHKEIFGIPLTPILFDPATNMSSALKLSVLIGTFMLSLGCAIEAINLFQKNEKADAVLVAIPKIFIFCGGVYMVFKYKFDLQAWFQGPLYILIIPIVVLVFGKLVTHLLSLKRMYPKESVPSLLGGGILNGWETVLQLLSHVPSFCRIFALSMVHIGLTGAVISLAEMSGNLVAGGIILVVGNLAVVIFEMLIVFVHALRLHFNEFFGKFYTGDGIQYVPFSVSKKFTALQFKIATGLNEIR
jgi:V/A-type H+-transporting ATPase subunit I